MDAPTPTGYTAPVALDGLGDGPGRLSAIPKNGAARSGAANTGSGPDHEPEGTRPMALNKDTGGIRPALDELSPDYDNLSVSDDDRSALRLAYDVGCLDLIISRVAKLDARLLSAGIPAVSSALSELRMARRELARRPS